MASLKYCFHPGLQLCYGLVTHMASEIQVELAGCDFREISWNGADSLSPHLLPFALLLPPRMQHDSVMLKVEQPSCHHEVTILKIKATSRGARKQSLNPWWRCGYNGLPSYTLLGMWELICKLGFQLYAPKPIPNWYCEQCLINIRSGFLYNPCDKIPCTEFSPFESLHDTCNNSVNSQD